MNALVDADPEALLDWYDRARRTLPWRALPGSMADPYQVWLSEIMLQQTTVAVVGHYYRRFLARWPSLNDLARARLDDVLHAWQGLGYYARARNLHRCAQVVVADHGGRFPTTEAALCRLPGIGPYTAAAIVAIAFDRRAVVVDGNVERVCARLFAVEDELPAAKPQLARLAGLLTPDRRPGDYAQAIMDLGATVCTPRAPKCRRCPWRTACCAHAEGIAAELPRKAPTAVRPTRHGIAFWTVRDDGALLLRRRPPRGLLGGMMEIPSTEWRAQPWLPSEAVSFAPVDADWHVLPGCVRHTFTHFHLELIVACAQIGESSQVAGGLWSLTDRLGEHALPSVMKKIVRHAIASTASDHDGPATSSLLGSAGAARRSGSARHVR